MADDVDSKFEPLAPGDAADPHLLGGRFDALRREVEGMGDAFKSLARSYDKLATAQLDLLGQLTEGFQRINKLEVQQDTQAANLADLTRDVTDLKREVAAMQAAKTAKPARRRRGTSGRK